MAMELKPIYFDNKVMITNNLATIFGVSYPVRAISSITIRRRVAASGVFQFLVVIIGAVVGFFGPLGHLWPK
jgi:hypothetical protein